MVKFMCRIQQRQKMKALARGRSKAECNGFFNGFVLHGRCGYGHGKRDDLQGVSGIYGDKYTVYYTPDECKNLLESTTGKFEGIGAVCRKNEMARLKLWMHMKMHQPMLQGYAMVISLHSRRHGYYGIGFNQYGGVDKR